MKQYDTKKTNNNVPNMLDLKDTTSELNIEFHIPFLLPSLSCGRAFSRYFCPLQCMCLQCILWLCCKHFYCPSLSRIHILYFNMGHHNWFVLCRLFYYLHLMYTLHCYKWTEPCDEEYKELHAYYATKVFLNEGYNWEV